MAGYRRIAGVDEVGCGPLAGPVVAGAVVLQLGDRINGLDDSKALTAREREAVAARIRRRALAAAVGVVDAAELDRIGLTAARRKAIRLALDGLDIAPDYLLLDAIDLPRVPVPQLAMVRADSACASVMAASIIAKVERDRMMDEFDLAYPGYGFAEHKGYAVSGHLQALARLGPSPIHRWSWSSVRRYARSG